MDARSRRSAPEHCDLVMKGGITSGVVYPQAVLALKDRYRFRNIGGGSVGAVAAALTAAAELGRTTENATGFGGMEEAQDKLAEERGFLQALFRPPSTYKPLMDAALAFAPLLDEEERMRLGKAGLFRQAKSNLEQCNRGPYRRGTLLAAAVGVGVGTVLGVIVGAILYALLFSILGRGFPASWTLLIGPVVVLGSLLGLSCGWLGGPIFAAYELFQLATRKMPEENFYGLCIGSGEPGTPEQPLLTDWLSELLDDLAGTKGEAPLTFGHLKEAPVEGKNSDEPGVALRMLTTNLNHSEPYLFPREANTLLFEEEEMRRFFPENVVGHLCKYAAKTGVKPPPGFRFLPHGDDLPVIVPVRMAISFPILLSTVPLYTIREASLAAPQEEGEGRELTEQDLQRNLFSDGGICSNFPIHFFDAWLPRHPTFGINLTAVPEEVAGETPVASERAAYSAGDDVLAAPSPRPDTRAERIESPTEPWLPRPDDPDSREWTSFEGLTGFFGAILNSAMGYRDTMQSRLPSYQERVVQVPLGSQEGGLNLDMEPEVIEAIALRGKRAGEMLLEFDFDQHRWVRLRVLLSELEAQLKGARHALRSVIDGMLVERQADGRFPHPFPPDQREHSRDARELLGRLDEFVAYLEQESAVRFPPIPGEDPQPALRITPNV